MSRYAGLLGIIVFLSIAYLFSTNRRAIRLKTVLWGLGLQFLFAWIVIRFTWGQSTLKAAGAAVNKLLAYSFKGSTFVFGNLGYPADPNAHLPFLDPGSSIWVSFFAFQVLPTIIFVSAFFALLYHLGVMQIIIKGHGLGHEPIDGRERRGVSKRGRLHLHGPDRSSAYHSPASS